MITKPHYQQLEKKPGQVKSADFCVQDAGANQNSVLSWRRSAPGSHGPARVSIHVHATKPAASQPQWPACFAQDLGAVGCRGRFHFPRLLCFMAFVGHLQFSSLLPLPGSLTNQHSLKPSSSRAKVWLHAHHGLPNPWPHPKCNQKNICTHEMQAAAISRQTIVNHTCKASACLLQCIGCAQGAT